jgi:hypothetical protein
VTKQGQRCDLPPVMNERALPPLPERMKLLPTHRGFPVPFFVASVDGVPDFRVMDGAKWTRCVGEKRCWLCGEKLGSKLAFVIGPMCAVTRTTAEPPSHRECAEFAVRACPFLANADARRRGNDLPADAHEPAGCMLPRNPGVTTLWMTRTMRIFRDPNGKPLIEMGQPFEVEWFCEGRPATSMEAGRSIETGLPALMEMAQKDGPTSVALLERAVSAAAQYLPREAP